jgi:hypothetical protein
MDSADVIAMEAHVRAKHIHVVAVKRQDFGKKHGGMLTWQSIVSVHSGFGRPGPVCVCGGCHVAIRTVASTRITLTGTRDILAGGVAHPRGRPPASLQEGSGGRC